MARSRAVLPGFGLSMGYTITVVSLVVLIPLSTLVIHAAKLGLGEIWTMATSPRALSAFGLTLGAAFAAALVDTIFGVLVAWVLIRYRFFGRGLLDALIDLPFALPTAVSGIALTALWSKTGWLGRIVEPLGIQVAFTRIGVALAMAFVSLPFVVRTVAPVLEELDTDMEESAATLGANRWQVFVRVIFPNLVPAALTGFALAFARAVGEYGSVVFISGNMPMKTEIASLLIMTRLEQFDVPGATAIALVLLIISFALLLAINRLQAWSRARTGLV